jgi:hypothetical protein
MPGIAKPDEFLMGSLDGLAVLTNQRRRAVRIVPPLKEQDWCPEVGPEFGEINFHHFGQQYIDGELRGMDPAVVIHRGIYGRERRNNYASNCYPDVLENLPDHESSPGKVPFQLMLTLESLFIPPQLFGSTDVEIVQTSLDYSRFCW